MIFNEWLILKENGRRTAGKTELYPLGYGGIGLYPDADYLTHSADAIVYLTNDKRLYKNGDNNPFNISNLPSHKQYGDRINSGDKDPFSIEKIPGKPLFPKDSNLPDNSISFKSFVKLVEKPKEIAPPDSKNMPRKF